jgi:hypothetical protein
MCRSSLKVGCRGLHHGCKSSQPRIDYPSSKSRPPRWPRACARVTGSAMALSCSTRPTLVPGEAPAQGVAPAPARPYQPSSSQDSPAKYGTKSAGALAGYRRLIPALVPTSAQQVLSAVVTMKRTRSRHTADVPQFCRPAASQFYLRNSSMAVSCLVTPVMYMCKSKCQRTNGLHMWSTSRIWPLIATVDAALLPKSDRVCVLPRA